MDRIDTFQPRHFDVILRDPDGILRDLQAALCAFTGKRHAVLCSSGSAALYMALRVRAPQHVCFPASTFPAIAEACYLCGAEHTAVDADPETWQSNLSAFYTTSPVHNYGCVEQSSNAYSGRRVVDAAAAMLTPGAFDGHGTFCVSFNWNKPISGGGGGALLTDDDGVEAVADGMKRHKGLGAFNFQMPALCAAEVFSQLAESDIRRAHLQELSAAYDEELRRVGLRSFPKGNTRWLTGTMLRDEYAVCDAAQRLVTMGHKPRHPWTPLGDRASCPGAWEIYDRGIVLPGGYTITPENVKEICKALDGLQ